MAKASDVFRARPTAQILIHGSTGSGKTTWAARSPRPLILLTEPQGLPSIVTVAPDAQVVVVDTIQRFTSVLDQIKAGKAVTSKTGQSGMVCQIDDEQIMFQTLVLDSFTDLQEKAVEAVEAKGQVTMQGWGRVIKVSKRILSDLRALPTNLVVLMLSVEEADESGHRHVMPMVYGKKLPNTVGQWFTAMGWATRMLAQDGEVQYVIVWKARPGVAAKPAPGFPGHTVARIDMPGQGTLGSLLAAAYPDQPTARAEGDAAELAGAIPEE